MQWSLRYSLRYSALSRIVHSVFSYANHLDNSQHFAFNDFKFLCLALKVEWNHLSCSPLRLFISPTADMNSAVDLYGPHRMIPNYLADPPYEHSSSTNLKTKLSCFLSHLMSICPDLCCAYSWSPEDNASWFRCHMTFPLAPSLHQNIHLHTQLHLKYLHNVTG